jgi:hypothetical protein
MSENPIQFLNRICEAAALVNGGEECCVQVEPSTGSMYVQMPAKGKYGPISIDVGKLVGLTLDQTVSLVLAEIEGRNARRKAEDNDMKTWTL